MNNVFGVVISINTLDNQLHLNLTIHEINYIYNLQNSHKFEAPRSRWYLKARRGPVRIVSYVPDSNKVTDGSYLIVLGNWHTENLYCPTNIGNLGL